MDDSLSRDTGCRDSDHGCVFAKALLAGAATCELVRRRSLAERELLECASPVARINCSTLAALLHERARFALRLPAPGRPLIHVHSLKLQCGGLTALRRELAAPEPDVHRMVGIAHQKHGSLSDLPWAAIVTGLAAWQPPRRARPRP